MDEVTTLVGSEKLTKSEAIKRLKDMMFGEQAFARFNTEERDVLNYALNEFEADLKAPKMVEMPADEIIAELSHDCNRYRELAESYEKTIVNLCKAIQIKGEP